MVEDTQEITRESQLIKNIASLMKRHGNLSVSELARFAEIPQPTLHHIVTGVTRRPRRDALEKIAEFFSISINELMGTDPLPSTLPINIKEDFRLVTVPILDWEEALQWPAAELKEKARRSEIITNQPLSHDCFSLVMNASNMEPLFPEGSILIFDPNREPGDRDYVLVYIGQIQQCVFKQLFRDAGARYLKSISPALVDVSLSAFDEENDRIIATLTESRMQFE